MPPLVSRVTHVGAAASPFAKPGRNNRVSRQTEVQGGVPLSAVVPVGPLDASWRNLIGDLRDLTAIDEVLFSAAEPEPDDFAELVLREGLSCRAVWLEGSAGRAAQMNRGARAAGGPYLWFLHCDSRLTPDAVASLRRSLTSAPDALHYFRLRFGRPRPRWMVCNEFGVAVRSRLFRMPFGDQALCLRKNHFLALGGFDESAPYGEDHLLVWAARRQKLPLRCTGGTVVTSSRKYLKEGWAATTLRHGWMTWKQAAGQLSPRRSSRR